MTSIDNINGKNAQNAITRLWPNSDSENASQIYAILDGARDHSIADMVRLSSLEYACLYAGKLSPALQQAAPYIVHLSPTSALTQALLHQAWGRSWGILVEAAPHVSLEQLRRHFRRLQRVSSEDGTLLVFRFYDPRVLRVYLPTCTLSESAQFFGPVTKIIIEAKEGADAGIIEYRKIAQGIDTRMREASGRSAKARDANLDMNRNARVSFEQTMAILDQSEWHANTLVRLLPQLRLRLPAAPSAIQRQWIDAVEKKWPQITAQLHAGCDDHVFQLGVVASELLYWKRAEASFLASLQYCGAHHATYYNLAIANWQIAKHDTALGHLERAIACVPENQLYLREQATLKAWRDTCRALLDADCLKTSDQPDSVYATLLGPHHAAALLHHQSDAELSRLVRLPYHQSVVAAWRWIQTQASWPEKTTLAVIHPEHGLIGVLAIERSGDAATFYYWISLAFQGRGHGHAALGLLTQLARVQGIRHLYSSVYESNTRSIGVMQRAGFKQLPHVADAVGKERLPYFHLALQASSDDTEESLVDGLQQLLNAIGSPSATRSPPQLDAPAATPTEEEVASC
jgi:RimJ/RimL family protein N-acetyltransferase